MKTKMVTLVGALALVGCGGLGEDPPDPSYNWDPWGSGPHSVGGTSMADGFGGGGTAVAGSLSGGHEPGGDGGTEAVDEGNEASGGEEADDGGGYGEGGTSSGGTSSGGTSSGGTGSSPDWVCMQNVTHCFDAAANCYEYSPWSDCDQIVDVCASMQDDCAAGL